MIINIYLGISLELLWAVWVSSVSDSSLFQLVLVLKVDRPPSTAQSILTAGFYSAVFFPSIAVPSSLFILAFSVFKSLQCLISALTQGGKGGHLFRLTCLVVLWERGTLQTNIIVMCGECSQCMAHTGFATAQGGVCFQGLHWSGFCML